MKLLLLCTLIAFESCIQGAPSENNHVLSNNLTPLNSRPMKHHDWLKISKSPPKILNTPLGARIELECEVMGSPKPQIKWVKDGVAITEDYDYENSLSNTAVGKLLSRLIINSAFPGHQGTISCIAESGTQKQFTSTRLYVIPQNGQQNFSEFLSSEMVPKSLARIVLFNSFLMDTIGSSIVLPCKVVGTPKPEIFWFDNDEELITNDNSRIKVLSNGALSISNLRWSDMGSYTCAIRNTFSKDSESTFVYPMLSEN